MNKADNLSHNKRRDKRKDFENTEVLEVLEFAEF